MDERLIEFIHESSKYEERSDFYYHLFKVLLNECKLSYNDKYLEIDEKVLTTVLKCFSRSEIELRIKELQEEKNNG